MDDSQNTKKSIHKHSDGWLIILSQLDSPDTEQHGTEILSGLLWPPRATVDIWCVFVIWFLGLGFCIQCLCRAAGKCLLCYWKNKQWSSIWPQLEQFSQFLNNSCWSVKSYQCVLLVYEMQFGNSCLRLLHFLKEFCWTLLAWFQFCLGMHLSCGKAVSRYESHIDFLT